MSKKDLSQKILATIKKKHIKPKPKYYFYLSSLLFGLSIAATIILTIFFFNLFTFHLTNPRPLPFMFIRRPLPLLFIVLTILALAGSICLLKKNQYRHSLLAIFFGALLFVFLGHFALNSFRSTRPFPKPLRRLYQHRQMPNPSPRLPRRLQSF